MPACKRCHTETTNIRRCEQTCCCATAAALLVRSCTAAAVARVFADTCTGNSRVRLTYLSVDAAELIQLRVFLTPKRTFSAVRSRVSSALMP